MKKCGKFQFQDILDKFELVCQSLLNLDEMCTISSLHEDTKNEKISDFTYFGPQVYPMGSMVIALVSPLVSWSVRL